MGAAMLCRKDAIIFCVWIQGVDIGESIALVPSIENSVKSYRISLTAR